MNVGLPGAGIGGLFYLLCALAMPIKEVILTVTRPEHKFRYRLVVTQLSIAIGIVLGVIAMYQLVSNVLGLDLSIETHSDSIIFYSLLPVLISLGLLLIILTSVRLVGLFSSPHKYPVASKRHDADGSYK
jgi:hypothetical protein